MPTGDGSSLDAAIAEIWDKVFLDRLAADPLDCRSTVYKPIEPDAYAMRPLVPWARFYIREGQTCEV